MLVRSWYFQQTKFQFRLLLFFARAPTETLNQKKNNKPETISRTMIARRKARWNINFAWNTWVEIEKNSSIQFFIKLPTHDAAMEATKKCYSHRLWSYGAKEKKKCFLNAEISGKDRIKFLMSRFCCSIFVFSPSSPYLYLSRPVVRRS